MLNGHGSELDIFDLHFFTTGSRSGCYRAN